MKIFVLLVSSFVVINATAQNTDYLASTGGFGPFKIGMSKAAVEKSLKTNLKLPNLAKNPDAYECDTVKCKYKELDVELVFSRNYFMNDTTLKVGIREIKSSSPLLKTKSGIAIGDDKLKIFKSYDHYRLLYVPEWDKQNSSKKAQVYLSDIDLGTELVFYLYDGRVTGFGAMLQEEGD